MSLLDSMLGAVQVQPNNPVGSGLVNLISTLVNNPKLVDVASGLLGNDGSHGGLGGLVGKFEQAGLGAAVQSWIGSGANHAVSGEQIHQALGSDTVTAIAAKLGVDPQQAAGQLAQLLPGLIDHLTPQGQAPAAGLGSTGDLMGLLGSVLRR